MSEPIRVFVNERGVQVPAGASVIEAVMAFDSALGERLRGGGASVTDGRGIALPPDAPLYAGAILRVLVSARRERNRADADP